MRQGGEGRLWRREVGMGRRGSGERGGSSSETPGAGLAVGSSHGLGCDAFLPALGVSEHGGVGTADSTC